MNSVSQEHVFDKDYQFVSAFCFAKRVILPTALSQKTVKNTVVQNIIQIVPTQRLVIIQKTNICVGLRTTT